MGDKRIARAALIAALAAIAIGMYTSWSGCAESGGALVRGLIWFECVSR